VESERARAAAWKHGTTTVSEEARGRRAVCRRGWPGYRFDGAFCLPTQYAAYSLLPEIRAIRVEGNSSKQPPRRTAIDGVASTSASRESYTRVI